MKYDKLGRSDGVAYVTYASIDDAQEAIRKFNGANAAGALHNKKQIEFVGQPITVTLDAEILARKVGPRRDKGRAPTRVGPPRSRGRITRRSGRGAPGSVRTQEDLDRELDDYLNQPVSAENANHLAEGGAGEGEEMAID